LYVISFNCCCFLLSIYREQIAPFHVDMSTRETSLDFSRLRTAAVSLFTNRRDILSLNSNNALLEFLLDGSPEVREYCRDSRKEVDRQLKVVCEQFISGAAWHVAGEMQAFTGKVDGHRASDKTANISRQTWAKPELLQGYVAQATRQLKKQFPLVQRAMQLYLCNKETEFILFRPIRVSLVKIPVANDMLPCSKLSISEQRHVLFHLFPPTGEGRLHLGRADHHRLPEPGADRRHDHLVAAAAKDAEAVHLVLIRG
jgi:hypothetical protein